MAKIVNSLWRSGNQDLLITPGVLPLDDLTVRNELVKYLPAGWDPIVDRDVDGSHAEPRRIDDDTPSLGSLQACRRSARTIFLGSAPSVSGAEGARYRHRARPFGLRCARSIGHQVRRCAATAHRPAALPVHGQWAVLVRSAHEPAA